jgi:hypothetical protein
VPALFCQVAGGKIERHDENEPGSHDLIYGKLRENAAGLVNEISRMTRIGG